ncbi:hypothetical protein JCM1841_000141 [Sporobolomyces salmonicolor]
MGVCIANGICFLILSFLAFLAHHSVSTLKRDTAPERSDASVWANPEVILTTLGVFFLLGLASFPLFYLVGFKASSSPETLRRTWPITTAFAIFVTAWSIAGDVMSFSSAIDGFEAACSEVDAACLTKFAAIEWTSIPLELVSILPLMWMLARSWKYGRALRSSSASNQDEEALLQGTRASASREIEADATRRTSLGRRSEKGTRSGYDDDPGGRRRETTPPGRRRPLARLPPASHRSTASPSPAWVDSAALDIAQTKKLVLDRAAAGAAVLLRTNAGRRKRSRGAGRGCGAGSRKT